MVIYIFSFQWWELKRKKTACSCKHFFYLYKRCCDLVDVDPPTNIRELNGQRWVSMSCVNFTEWMDEHSIIHVPTSRCFFFFALFSKKLSLLSEFRNPSRSWQKTKSIIVGSVCKAPFTQKLWKETELRSPAVWQKPTGVTHLCAPLLPLCRLNCSYRYRHNTGGINWSAIPSPCRPYMYAGRGWLRHDSPSTDWLCERSSRKQVIIVVLTLNHCTELYQYCIIHQWWLHQIW